MTSSGEAIVVGGATGACVVDVGASVVDVDESAGAAVGTKEATTEATFSVPVVNERIGRKR